MQKLNIIIISCMIFLFLVVKPAFAQTPLYWDPPVPWADSTFDDSYIEPGPNTGVWLGLHWPTIGRGLGQIGKQIGLNVVTLGGYYWYGVGNKISNNLMDNPDLGVGYAAKEIGLSLPVVADIRAAINADSGLERAGHISGAFGTGILIGLGVTAKFSPGTYNKLSTIKIPPQRVFYVNPEGVTIASKWGMPSEAVFGGEVGEVAGGGGLLGWIKEHPLFKRQEAIQLIEDVGGYQKIVDVLRKADVKKMGFWESGRRIRNIPHEILKGEWKGYKKEGKIVNPVDGRWVGPGKIKVYIGIGRTRRSVARTLVHEGYHDIYRYRMKGIAEYRAYRVAGRFGKKVNLHPLSGPYKAAMQGRGQFGLYAQEKGWDWPIEK